MKHIKYIHHLQLDLQLFSWKTSLPEGKYCGYLRKSRVDLEAEANGEEDTYARHERILFDLARRLGISLTYIYREKPISGERISERPEMIKLLEDVENGEWQGVLVVEVERLARGDTMDQGIVAQAFKYSETLIVTPQRTYDPNDPNDEEYFEFGLFMSRREFKTINRRLQGGRNDGVDAGRYLGSKPPYGYKRVKLPGKGYTLEPHPDQAPIVKLIFEWYTKGELDPETQQYIPMGSSLIANKLNDLKVPTATGKQWIVATILGILKNPVYIGKVRWGSRPLKKDRFGKKSRPRSKKPKLVNALHPAIIDETIFEQAQMILNSNYHTPAPSGVISNPLAGLVRCDMCGGPMVYRPYVSGQKPSLICYNHRNCDNVSCFYHLVEENLLKGLSQWLKDYKIEWNMKKRNKPTTRDDMVNLKRNTLKALEKHLEELQKQKGNLHDLVEQGVYTKEVFLERSNNLADRIQQAQADIEQTKQELEEEMQRVQAYVEVIPKIEKALELYPKTDDPAKKNTLLKSILEYATYRRESGGRWGPQDNFTLKLKPRLPK